MSKETSPIPVTEVPQDTREFLAQVLADGRAVVVEVEGGQVAVGIKKPARRSPAQARQDRIKAALATAGSCADLDLDEMLDELERRDKEVPPTPLQDEL